MRRTAPMIHVFIREQGRGLRAERAFTFEGLNVLDSVRLALWTMYPDAELGSLDVADAGTFRRTIERPTLLGRRVVIKVRVQGELFG